MRRFVSILLLSLTALWAAASSRTVLRDGWTFSLPDEAPEQVSIPHTWNERDAYDSVPGYLRTTGTYTRVLHFDSTESEQLHSLLFLGANQLTHVYLNDRFCGMHAGGYTRFLINIEPYIRYDADNILRVEVSNAHNEDIPPLSADYTFFGGIYRDVWLLAESPRHFAHPYATEGVFLTPEISDSASARLTCTVHLSSVLDTAADTHLRLDLLAPDGTTVGTCDTLFVLPSETYDKAYTFRFALTNPVLWSPATPNLYTLRAVLEQDTLLVRTGFRWFAFREDGFYLNGAPLKLLGTNRHQCIAGQGWAMTEQQHIRDVQMIKHMGSNFLRVSHYPQDAAVMDACDSLGLLSSVEVPIVNAITVSEEFTQNCLQMTREMVMQDYNHPSVVIWAYMNEVLMRPPSYDLKSETFLSYGERLYELADRIEQQIRCDDPSRVTLIPLHAWYEPYQVCGLTRVPMVLGFNLYKGWYDGEISDFGRELDRLHALEPGRPLFVTEYGADNDVHLHSFAPVKFDYTTEYAEQFHLGYLQDILRRDWVVGATVWNFNDFASEARGNAVPHMNVKGLVTYDRQPKSTYRFYEAALCDDARVYIGSRNWTERHDLIDAAGVCVQPVDVYTNRPYTRLLHDGTPLVADTVGTAGKATVLRYQVPMHDGDNRLMAMAGCLVMDTVTIHFTADIPESLQATLRGVDSMAMLQPVSVMQKPEAPRGGTMHDYYSLARYFWPDSTRKNGLPYINRDGFTNPEIHAYDRDRLGEMVERVRLLALAYDCTRRERYAEAAVRQLRTWFTDEETRMTPHLQYAQVVRGKNKDRGRCYGLIDTYSLIELPRAIAALEKSDAFTAEDGTQLRQWFAQLLTWMQQSRQGREEAAATNNHAIAYDVQCASYALFTGDTAAATAIVRAFPARRLYPQIAADGSQPKELARTRSLHYSIYNLTHMLDMAELAVQLDIHLLDSVAENGASIAQAERFIGAQIAGWPYPEIGNRAKLTAQYLEQHNRLMNLLAMAALSDARRQMQLLVGETHTQSQGLSPRNIQPDGTVRYVGETDWCVGFYPGCLWLLHENQEAARATWRIEEAKNHRGSHDLGFVINCSFGRMLDASGEGREVLITAADNLMKRFSLTTGCIRSWDFNTEHWRYPVIIDNMMNLELLFRATELTSDSAYYRVAVSHANRTMENHFREDGSSYHVVDYDPETGAVRLRETAQGAADESVWSRGQAWGLYGYTMCYRYTHDSRYLAMAERIAAFIFSQPNMPEDLVPYWDMRIPADRPYDRTARDVSAAAITASALYELLKYTNAPLSARYLQYADGILASLTEHYRQPMGSGHGFLLTQSVGHMPAGSEVSTAIIYADYYYLEALSRRLERK